MAIQHELESVRDWAKAKVKAGQEPPWAWYQYMKLIETTETILAAQGVTRTESSPQSVERSGTHLRPVDSTYQQDDAPRDQDDSVPQMPM